MASDGDAVLHPRVAQPAWSSPWRPLARFAKRKPLGFAGLVILVIVGAGGLFANVVAPYDYAAADFAVRLQGPSWAHLFGTDDIGRDLLSRVLYGVRVSLGISFAAVVLAKVLATVIALLTGYYGGYADKVGQRLVDVWLALPRLVVLITLVGLFGASIVGLVVIIALANAPSSARLIRSAVVSVRSEPYIEAAQSVGAGDLRVILQYVLPNVMHIIIFSATSTLGAVILVVASLGFLGYGVPPPAPDLGAMLSGSGLTFMQTNPWMALWPGLVITIVVFAFNVLGDALRDVLDPRLRGTH